MKAILSAVPVSDTLYAIGTQNNELLVSCKEDMKIFKDYTIGKSVLMGRKTVESLPFKLPNRHTICVTREENYQSVHADHTVRLDMEEIYQSVNEYWGETRRDIVVCGGAEIYKQLFHLCDEIVVSFFSGVPVRDINDPVCVDLGFLGVYKTDTVLNTTVIGKSSLFEDSQQPVRLTCVKFTR